VASIAALKFEAIQKGNISRDCGHRGGH